MQTDPADVLALQINAQLAREAQGPIAALPLLERAVELAPRNLDLLGDYAAT